MNRKLWLVCLLLFTSLVGWSQTFPNTKEKFVKDFQKKISEYSDRDLNKFVKDEFAILLLETQEFPDDYFAKLVESCNKMEVKRLKVYPEIYNYVYSVTTFVTSKQPKESYLAWQSTVDKMLESRQVKKIKSFVEFTAGFLSNGNISTSSNFAWFYLGGNYAFEFDSKVQVNLSGGNLVCRAIGKSGATRGQTVDSLRVLDTDGVYDPVLKKWIGNSGKITWNKVGLDPTKNYAELSEYDLSLKSSTIRFDSVSLTTPYFNKPILGTLTDRAFKINREEDKIYPQFLSFEKRLVIDEIVIGVDYVGGFALEGASFVGAGTDLERAMITIKKDGVPFITAKAKEVVVSTEKISVYQGEMALFFKTGDSLSHPGISLSYSLEKKQIQLTRAKSGIGQAPFQDSYHKLDVYVPKIIWNLDEEELHFTYEFGTSQEQRVAQFESQAYFDTRLYDKLQSMEATHPLVAISKYCYKYDEYTLTEGQAATALNKTVEQSKSLLLELSSLGFISYDSELKTVVVKDKLNNFVRAKVGKRDYDNIVFTSDLRPRKLSARMVELAVEDPAVTDEFNQRNRALMLKTDFAVMSLVTLDLDLEAVDHVLISANKNTIVFPNDGIVKVKENRDFLYAGWTNAGKLETDVTLASFSYEKFVIKLQKTEESLFRIRPLDKTHGTSGIAMVSRLKGVSGEIQIDDPSNRSGVNTDFGAFPKLVSVNTTKVFYNYKDIYRGAYDSTRFYYAVVPFTMDSLNNFKESSMRLEGELVSAGIFPTITEPLKIMQDYSFGFSTVAPEGGHEFYGSEAKYENRILLSHNGLQGDGTISFIASTSVSKALSFLPDSTVGYANFVNRPVESGVEFPDAHSERAFITYIPKQNILRAASTAKNDISMFNDEAQMRGTVIIRPSGMRGFGLMSFNSSNLISKDFEFKRYDILSDTSSFRLKNQGDDTTEDALVFKTDNVKATVSFKDRVGTFNSNDGERKVEFPVNQYVAKMDLFKWMMDDLTIVMEKSDESTLNIDIGVDLVGSNFYSTHPDQDTLNFRAPRAKFDARKKTIYCSKVEYIDVADARIYPDSMRLNIRKKAKMDPLENATIVANYITKFHRFEKADVEIKARRDYKAEGQYPYYDVDSNVTYIAMKNISLDTSYQTKASGKVSADEDFKLSKEFDYYGDVSIYAANPLISFSGATRINHDCEKFDRNWMAFQSEVDPKNIQIPVVGEMKDLEGGSISAGIVWRDSPNTDSIALYPTFLSSLVGPGDPIVMTSSGYLQYDGLTKEFQIASKDKLLDRGEKGNYIALHTESCSMNGDGVIDLGMDYGDVAIETVGVVNYNQSTGKTTMNLTARFDMPLDKNVMEASAERLNEIEGLQPADFSSNTLEQAIVEWDGLKAADKFVEEYVQEGKVKKLPDGLEKSITITGLRLSSYESSRLQTSGLITDVESAVLVSYYGKPVMKYVPLKAFFQQTYSGVKGKTNSDMFTVYMDIPGGSSYLYNYKMAQKDGVLKILSSDAELSGAITAIKEDKRKKKNFNYEMTSSSAFLATFMRLFE
jgi:hypothetical protein